MKTPERAPLALIIYQLPQPKPLHAPAPLLEYVYDDELPPEIERVLRANRQSEE